MERRGPAVLDRTLIAINNLAVRLRRTRCRPDQVLVLFSRCLQRSTCDRKLDEKAAACARCGKCAVKAFLDLGEKYGVHLFLATGGRQAAARASDPGIRAIVAVACEKELRAGVFAALPKATLARTIAWPCGPCKDTVVRMDEVEEAVRWFIR
jgi:hypothetical protein